MEGWPAGRPTTSDKVRFGKQGPYTSHLTLPVRHLGGSSSSATPRCNPFQQVKTAWQIITEQARAVSSTLLRPLAIQSQVSASRRLPIRAQLRVFGAS